MQELDYYENLFAHLHTAKRFGRPAPHKAILMLSIIDLVEVGSIDSPYIPLTDVLVNKFNYNWKRYLGALRLFTPDICKPFFHMQYEPFWSLRDRENDCYELVAEPKSTILGAEKKVLPKGGYSLRSLRQSFCWAEIDPALFNLMHNQEARGRLRVVLISNYLTDQPIGRDTLTRLSVVSALAYFLAS